MTGTASDARVTTVTAEVRVLMVGSRQVTLSVAKQLDHADLSKVEPFGRVRLGDGEKVIGRSRKDGMLVLATFERHPGRVPYVYETDLDAALDSRPVVCDKATPDHEKYFFRLQFRSRQIRLYADATSRCGIHPHGITDTAQCEHWDPNGHDKHMQAAVDAWDAGNALHDQAAKLPLIVLAGLR